MTPPIQTSPNALLTPKEAAAQLGVAPVTIRLWAQENKLPFTLTPGGHRRFRQEDIDNFVNQHMNKPAPTLSVLIVDDNEEHAEFLSEYIHLMGKDINTAIAYDGFEAGQLIYEMKPELVLLDLIMPGMDGYAVCQRIKNNPATKNIRIIAMTGFSTPENIERILKAGAEVCLSKPINTQKLTEILLQSVNQHGEQKETAQSL